MKLSDAMVSTDGTMIARGTLELPSVPTELFACHPHEFLSIRLDHWCDVTPVAAKKTADTGYLLTRPVGPTLAFGRPLVAEFRSALVALTERSMVRSTGGGGLSSTRDPLKAKGQDLHNCTLICALGPNRRKDFVFEATIGARKSEEWKSRNWPQAEGLRMAARFSLNGSTACLVAGSVGDLTPELHRDASPAWGGSSPNLLNSVCGWSGSTYAASNDGSVWGILDDRELPLLILNHAVKLHELEGGFYGYTHRSYRLVIIAFSLHQLLGFGSSDPVRLLRLEGQLGSYYSTTGREPDIEKIIVIEGGVAACDIGLRVDLTVKTETGRELTVDFTLSRETCLVRYPRVYRQVYGEISAIPHMT